MRQEILAKINTWKYENRLDKQLKEELYQMNEEELNDAFYTDLAFGTGGLRGILGVGTNRMNIYTVGKATRGFSEYVLERYEDAKERGIVIAYDCRHYSVEFAHTAASVIAGLGIKVYLFSSFRPTPELSFAVRKLNCVGGIMITASHNPSNYNGYKVSDHNGCQLTPVYASKVIAKIEQVDNLFDIPAINFDEGIKSGIIQIVDKEVDAPYIDAVKTITVQSLPSSLKKNIKIVFTPASWDCKCFFTKYVKGRRIRCYSC